MSIGHNSGGVAAERLRSFVERFERLQEEIDELKADQKEVLDEAKGSGFDVPTIRDILRLRKLEKKHGRAAVKEREELLDLYRAALGMLWDTPLGEAARKRLSAPPPPKTDPQQRDIEDPPEENASPARAPEPPAPTAEDIAAAREAGREAAATGVPVTANPYPAGDPRRAAWDEEWCRATGSDGMDLPAAWRRTTPKKRENGNGNAGAQDDAEEPRKGGDGDDDDREAA